MIDLTSAVAEWIIVLIACISVLLPLSGQRFNIPSLVLIGRWFRWFFFAALFAFSMRFFELSYRPDWVHLLTGAGLWFLLETGYNWIAIGAVSRSEIPLFPKFQQNLDGDEWPADERLIGIKEWLRLEKFTRVSALKSKLYEDMYLRTSVYQSEDCSTRIQVLFVPKGRSGSTAFFTISTAGKNQARIITDNLSMPFGGYYPEVWNLKRKPLIGNLVSLLAYHRNRLLNLKIDLDSFEDDPLYELNDQQKMLERLNVKTGFLLPQTTEDSGRITYDGRYRIWKEMWFLAYLGRSIN